VENAIQHGIAPTSRPGSVTITARGRDGQLVVEVCNDGLASNESELAERGLGIGIRNTIERLSRLYGNAFAFELGRTDRGTVATVTLPLRLEAAA
jgi:two-component system LytT family sensor kinase